MGQSKQRRMPLFHRRIPDDTPRDLRYVWFITLRDGQVMHFRDYMNPLQLSTL